MTLERLAEIREAAAKAAVGCGPWLPGWVTEALDAYEVEMALRQSVAKAFGMEHARAERAEAELADVLVAAVVRADRAEAQLAALAKAAQLQPFEVSADDASRERAGRLRAEALLRKLEWVGKDGRDCCCPACAEPSLMLEDDGGMHHPTCELAAIIGAKVET